MHCSFRLGSSSAYLCLPARTHPPTCMLTPAPPTPLQVRKEAREAIARERDQQIALMIASATTGGLTLEQQQQMLGEARERAEAAAATGGPACLPGLPRPPAGPCWCPPDLCMPVLLAASPLPSLLMLHLLHLLLVSLLTMVLRPAAVVCLCCSCRCPRQVAGREGPPAHSQVRC
jgi:hypothetical protein